MSKKIPLEQVQQAVSRDLVRESVKKCRSICLIEALLCVQSIAGTQYKLDQAA